jgi:hypothetical protein
MGQNRHPAAGALEPVPGHARLSGMRHQIILDESPYHFPEQFLRHAVAQMGGEPAVVVTEVISAGSALIYRARIL